MHDGRFEIDTSSFVEVQCDQKLPLWRNVGRLKKIGKFSKTLNFKDIRFFEKALTCFY